MGMSRTVNRGREFSRAGASLDARLAGNETAVHAAKAILEILLKGERAPITIRLWNGEAIHLGSVPRCTVFFRHPGALRRVVLHRDVLDLAEAHMGSEIELEGDLEVLVDLLERMSLRKTTPYEKARLFWLALKVPDNAFSDKGREATDAVRANSRSTITHHYDVGNDFYQSWLDPKMLYSCAYFHDEDQPLAAAQEDKMDYLCRKLRLAPGQKLLDIGCGWGALVCHAAERFGITAHGITLSPAQQALASRRIARRGLGGRVTVSLCDYRELPGDAAYDRVVSVGMFEHVGIANIPSYFETVKRVLRPGGLFLNHSITRDTGWRETPCTRFTNRHIFPDAELIRVSDMVDHMERAGFEILDVEAMRRHYLLTVRRWMQALEARREKAVEQAGEPTWRAWRLYLAGAARSFEAGQMNLYQVLVGHARQPLTTPLRRDDLYRTDRQPVLDRNPGTAHPVEK